MDITSVGAFSLERRDIEALIKKNLQTVDERFGEIATLFVENGYCLRRQLKEKMYAAAGFETFEEYVKETYGKSRSWAKRMMQINEKFSINGNHPRIDEKYIGYSVSQLQEMLYLTDEQMEDVSPDMTVKEIREVRKPEKKLTPIERGCITGFNPNGTCACCGNEGTVECCAECTESCNVRCGWIDTKESCATSHKEEKACSGKECFNCSQECQERQEDRYCVEAPLGNPFLCNTMNVMPILQDEMGDKCQFINHELAYHRAGNGAAVPCCKECDELCGYRCSRAGAKYQGKDEAWFVKEYIRRADKKEINKLVQICKENKSNGDRAKAVQKYLSPYGARYYGSNEFSFSFHGFSGGIDFTADERNVEPHMKYGRFVKELLELPEFSNIQELEQTEEVQEEECKVVETAEVQQVPNQNEVIIDGEYKEISDERYEETTEDSDIKLLKKMLDNESHMLKMLSEEYTDNDVRVRKAKLKVGAFASMLSDLEEIEVPELEKTTEQPEMPVLKNNDQRKAFLENYLTWPIWFEVPEASETYHRYNLPDGSSIVICEYLYYAEWKKRYNNESLDAAGTREYLLKPGYHYLQDCKTNTSALVEHLKNVMKGEK